MRGSKMQTAECQPLVTVPAGLRKVGNGKHLTKLPGPYISCRRAKPKCKWNLKVTSIYSKTMQLRKKKKREVRLYLPNAQQERSVLYEPACSDVWRFLHRELLIQYSVELTTYSLAHHELIHVSGMQGSEKLFSVSF